MHRGSMIGGSLHEDLSREDEVVGPSERRFGLTFAVLCGLVGLVRLMLGHAHAGRWLGAAVIFAGLGLFWTAPLAPLNKLWLRLGLLLYRVVNPLIMALLFFTTMLPIGLLMRLFGKDPLRLRRDPAAASYWLPREMPGPPPTTMRNQF
ncbi:MAG: hypothetical protein JO305_01085 [Alphaproteobacteria bacterium]|nr:hypothetical protein [Alphaproteobacteria bacterium]